jgi:hypothetical protein
MTPRVFITKPLLRYENKPHVVVQFDNDLFLDVGAVEMEVMFFWISNSFECDSFKEFQSREEIVAYFSQLWVLASIKQRMAAC